ASSPKDAPRRRPAWRRPAFWLALLIVLAAGGWWFAERGRDAQSPEPGGGSTSRLAGGPRGGPGQDGARPLPVTVAIAERRDVPLVLDALGTVTSLNTVTVRSQVDGQLMGVHFREGQPVRAGDLLAEIDPRPFEVALAQAEGQMARDRALLENARVDLERYRTLVKQDAASTQQLDTQKALVRQYEGIVQADKGLVDSARLQLSWTRITAPLSGRLGLRLVDPGNLVRANDTTGLVTITQIRPIGVTFALPERDLSAVLKRQRAGQRMPVQALDRDQRTVLADGVLTTLDNQIDTATGTLRMKAEFANENAALFPNQFVNVRLSVDTLPGAIVVPAAAIQRGSRGTFVYVVGEGERSVLRPVSTGPEHREATVIEAGVEAGERVVVDGVDNLREGTQVEAIVKAELESSSAAPAQPGPGAPDRSR
ncbi:MAG TPA: MdtA/MuxA family multidrug efflux RND transporter periplasmic adaptor subunit, partial [Burkholderiaceae bacterium]|nr:MdtA/MuxA family multidrug efflux RND transporter periplasmic adaptor subunit [Burkholderiaceae bacterium]